MKRTVTLIVILCLVIVALFLVHPIVLGKAKVVTLQPAPPLTGQISQFLVTNINGTTSMEVAGKDYTLRNIHYFDNGTWAFAAINPTNPDAQGSVVILKKVSGVYMVALGPGTSFPKNSSRSLPNDLTQYLTRQGYF